MATKLTPELIAQLAKMRTGEARLIDGYNYQPTYGGYNFASAESGGSGMPEGIGEQTGWDRTDPRQAASAQMIDGFDASGGFTGSRKGTYDNPLTGVLTVLAAAYGMHQLGSMLSAGAAGGAASGGAAAAGDWGALESLGNLAEPGYFTAGAELPGALANVGAAAPEVVGGAGGGMFGALEGLGTLGGADGALAAAGGAGAVPAATTGLNAMRAGELAGYATNGTLPTAATVAAGPTLLQQAGSALGAAPGDLSASGGLIPGISNDNLMRFGAPLIGGVVQSIGANSAAKAQIAASREANALQRGIYDDTVARNAPFVSGGLASFNALLEKLGLGGDKTAPGYGSFNKIPTAEDVMAEPGYQFGQREGQKAIDNKLNVQGMTYSGAALKAAGRYNNDYATTKFDGAFNRGEAAKTNQYNKLSGVATLGVNASNHTAAAGTSYATTAGQNIIGGGDARAANSLAQGNILSGAINQGVSSYLRNSGGNQGKIFVPGLGWVTPEGGG